MVILSLLNIRGAHLSTICEKWSGGDCTCYGLFLCYCKPPCWPSCQKTRLKCFQLTNLLAGIYCAWKDVYMIYMWWLHKLNLALICVDLCQKAGRK